MKTSKILILFVLILSLNSCFNDLGNYEYLPKDKIMPVTIEGLKDTTIILGETLELTPTLKNMDNESKYTYLWYVTPSAATGYSRVRDTLSLEKNLSAEIKIKTGEYLLIYEVRDPELDVYVRDEVKLQVIQTNIKAGWYVLKDIDEETDFDYINLDGSLTVYDVLRNIGGYQKYSDGPIDIGNQQLQGKAVKMIWQNQRYDHQVVSQDGVVQTIINKQAFHIITDKDFRSFNPDNLYLYKKFEEAFYEAPTKNPQEIGFSFLDLYIINNGKLHSIFGNTPNVGKFPAIKTSATSPDYELHPSVAGGVTAAIVFDKKTRSFFLTTANSPTLNVMPPPMNPTLPSLSNMNYDLIDLLKKDADGMITSFSGYYLMKKIDTEEYYLAYVANAGTAPIYPFVKFTKVASDAKMPMAQVKAIPRVASCVYFGINNELSYYLDATNVENNEKLIYTFPSDEEITFISNSKAGILTVLTNSASGWKLYGFPIIGATPDIEPEPSFVYSGSGNGRYVMYRAS